MRGDLKWTGLKIVKENWASTSSLFWITTPCCCYRPHPKDGEGTIFTGVCLSTPGGGVYPGQGRYPPGQGRYPQPGKVPLPDQNRYPLHPSQGS